MTAELYRATHPQYCRARGGRSSVGSGGHPDRGGPRGRSSPHSVGIAAGESFDDRNLKLSQGAAKTTGASGSTVAESSLRWPIRRPVRCDILGW